MQLEIQAPAFKEIQEDFDRKTQEQKSKKVKARLSIEKTDDFQHLRESMLQDLKKPENKAVFERLKDK